MNETEFHNYADAELVRISDALEEADARGELEMEFQNGILNLALPDGKRYVLSKHAPSRQLWLSSPVSGGLHFSRVGQDWSLADGRTLARLLAEELRACGVKAEF